MKKDKDVLNLTDDLFIGHGLHKECYHYPGRDDLCVKVAYNHGGVVDLRRETRYRRVLQFHHADTSMLPAYYGTVDTNKGKGYVYEIIRDYDGKVSQNLEYFFSHEDVLHEHFEMIIEQLEQFHQKLYKNSILTMGIVPENIIVQQYEKGKYTFRLINDMGSAALIPLEYVVDSIAKIRVNKRWNQFLKRMEKWHREGRLPSPLLTKVLKIVQ